MAEGALFFLQQPLALLVVLAAGLLLQATPGRQLPMWIAAFAGLAALTWFLPPATWQRAAAAGYLALAGGWQAVGRGLRGAAPRMAAAAGGLPLGWSASVGVATPAEAAGSVGTAVLLLLLAGMAARLLRRFFGSTRGWAVGSRILGSWLAAIGLLLIALAIARGR